jgi:hypothetical protein
MYSFYELSTNIFDPIHSFWERPKTKQTVAVIQVAAFLLGILGIELNRRGLLPPLLARVTPSHHGYAINLAFTLVLAQEVIDLIFALPCSISKSVGKQFEILCLIMIRNSFKELVHFNEPFVLGEDPSLLYPMIADGVGALLIFLGLSGYLRIHKRTAVRKRPWLYSFVAMKKFLSLTLLAIFFALALYVGWDSYGKGAPQPFFDVFYTLLIFCDILIVLISHIYQPAFRYVFRNSGFALCTLLIRLALAAPPIMAPILGVVSILVAIGISLAYKSFSEEQ